MKEKDFQIKFNKWVRSYYPRTAVFELKLTHGKSLPFDAVQEHQVFALKTAKHDRVIFKIPDAGFQNPFDSFQISYSDAFVVIMFYTTGKKEFYMIDIDEWIKESKTSSRKSITEDRAKEIGLLCIL